MTPAEARELLAACKRQRDVRRIGGMAPSPEAVARVEREEAAAHAAIVEDYDREHAARVAAEAEADGLRRDLVAAGKARDEAVALIAALASGEIGSCFECWRFAMRAHANGDQCCDKHSDDNDPEAWSDLPHAAAIRGALKATEGER